jgi:probable phosphoglycerate mutase
MTLLALIRHGETAWNAEHRLQGRTDIGLSPKGAAELRALAPPAALAHAVWLTSPLRRARQTAALLRAEPAVEPLLIEAHWGAWEGLTDAVVGPLAARMAARGTGGLDLRPPGGESPRDVRHRLSALMARLAPLGGTVAAVTHRGVIRAALSLATGWDMTGKPPVTMTWRAAHLFEIAADGSCTLHAANVPLEASP